ncbi:hypothetical protein C7M84_023879 [Penaeus vannamei]|uniref:Uncharacterized protein n=1 Tax=Penaeus vannamei TaxID=6689 RepID=A0A423U2T6_PENVA|nr:hypothetical protein C7M84_023879 [Penaeus vannamei]
MKELITGSTREEEYKRTSSGRSSVACRDAPSPSTPSATRILREASKLPADTVEDALLPRRPEEETLEELTGSRALAIRLVDHPAPTNCTKYVVLRPNTAPSPAPTTKPPLLPKRPKTSKIIRKVPEIEFALKRAARAPRARGARSRPEAATRPRPAPSARWTRACTCRGRRGTRGPTRESSPASWSGCGWTRTGRRRRRPPAGGRRSPSRATGPEVAGGSLPSVASRASSGRSSCGAKLPLKVGSAAPPSPDAASRRISMDAQRLAEASPKSAPKSRMVSPGGSGRHSAASRASFRDSARSSRSQRAQRESSHASGSPRPPAKEPPVPKLRDPLEIMETMDSVFHTVPLRDTGRGTHTCRSEAAERRKGVAAAATQTEEQAQEFARRAEDDAGGGAGGGLEAKVRHNHPRHLRSRNCLACELRAMEEPPRKFAAPSDYKAAFRAGKPQPGAPGRKKARYLKQSEKYDARLKARHEPQRFWPINTLSSPFCNRPGYGQDQYPDHMRLRSTYGMAHVRHAKPVHAPLIKKLYL